MNKFIEMLPEMLDIFPKLLNPPDIIILLFVLANCVFGFKQGLLRSVYGLFGKAIVLIGSVFAAKEAAPIIAEKTIMPLIGNAIDKQLEKSNYQNLLEGLRENAEEAAASVSESIAYLLLLVIFGIVFGWIVALVYRCLKSITRLAPVNVLDSIGGTLIGFAAGIALIALILLCIEWFSPITYSDIGWLSPERVANSVLLAKFVDMLPVAI